MRGNIAKALVRAGATTAEDLYQAIIEDRQDIIAFLQKYCNFAENDYTYSIDYGQVLFITIHEDLHEDLEAKSKNKAAPKRLMQAMNQVAQLIDPSYHSLPQQKSVQVLVYLDLKLERN